MLCSISSDVNPEGPILAGHQRRVAHVMKAPVLPIHDEA
jgi:hypothetical protein